MSDKKSRKCMDCEEEKPMAVKGSKVMPRCVDCHRKRSAALAAASRLKRKIELSKLGETRPGWKVCSKCYGLKRFSEFRTVRGRPTKICDACLTRVYSAPSRAADGFGPIFWRRRAYTCNTAYRIMTASRLGVPVASIKLADLDYACKPQDLIKIFERQNGRCFYCNEPLLPDDTTSVDHAEPKSKGGAHRPRNFRICCRDCNNLKWKRGEQEFLEFLRKYTKRDFRVADRPDKEPVVQHD